MFDPYKTIVALDPAASRCGIAIGWPDRHNPGGPTLLRWAGTVHGRAPALTRDVVDVVRRCLPEAQRFCLVTEWPEDYSSRTGVARDLASVRAVAQGVDMLLGARAVSRRRVKPRSWKGQAPKAVTARRAVKVLRAEERAALPAEGAKGAEVDGAPWPYSTGDDTMDAVGLLLWAAGRAGRGVTS